MSSGGKKTESVTNVQQSGPPSWAVPYYQNAFNMAGNVANQPYTPYQGARIAGLTDDQYASMDMTRDMAAAPSAVGSANTYVNNVLGGSAGVNPYQGKTTAVGGNKYAGPNPYLGHMVGAAQKDVTNAYKNSVLPNQLAQFNAGGAYGGTAHQAAMSQSNQDLAGALGDVSTQLRGQDYYSQQQLAESAINRSVGAQQTDLARNSGLADARLGRQQQAAQMAPGLDQARYYGADRLAGQGAVQQDWLQSLLDQNYGDFTEARDWDANRLGLLTNALASVNGGTSSSSTGTQANPNYRSAGQNAAGYAALLASLWG